MGWRVLSDMTEFRVELETWALANPFRIAGYTFEAIDVVMVSLRRDGQTGSGEAAGVYYRADTPSRMVGALERLRARIQGGMTREELQTALPPGGARNALDCALWDLEAKLAGRHVWQLAQVNCPRPLLTTFTCPADAPSAMAEQAGAYREARALKLKLTGEAVDGDRIHAVREARPDVWLAVDANQALTPASLTRLMPTLQALRVELLEQPFALGREADLDGFRSPIPIAADESVQGIGDLPGLQGRFNVVNIKLDKCGGLTEGLAMARAARALGLGVMVGNMMGTSLAMAPAFVLGQLCDVVDLDGPVFLVEDRLPRVRYAEGRISCPQELWG